MGANQSVGNGALVALTAVATDPNTPPLPLTFHWTQTVGPIVALSGADTTTATFTAPTLPNGAAPLIFGFMLTVSNPVVNGTGTVSVTVTSPRLAPIVTAGANQIVRSAAPVTLNGSASTDVNTPTLPLTFAWTQLSGAPVVLANASTAIATFTAPALAAGSPSALLVFSLRVSNGPASATAPVSVTVDPPAAISALTVAPSALANFPLLGLTNVIAVAGSTTAPAATLTSVVTDNLTGVVVTYRVIGVGVNLVPAVTQLGTAYSVIVNTAALVRRLPLPAPLNVVIPTAYVATVTATDAAGNVTTRNTTFVVR
jgi:hypothetical protein